MGLPLNVVPVPGRAAGNDLYPLPPDYLTLTAEGQRMARVNACSLWQLPGTVEERQDAMEASVYFFDHQYLWPDAEDDFDPLYYEDPPCATALFHRAMWRAWGSERATLSVFPRGAAKSTSLRTSLFPLILTRNFSVIYATSSHDNAELTGHKLKTQLRENRRIVDDFSPGFPGGRITPRRGQAAFGSSLLYLTNQAWVRMLSSESKSRGGRPHLYALDDPEYDPKASTSMESLRAYMLQLIFKIVIPMVTRPGCSVRWTATFVSKQHLAWYAMQTVDDGGVRRALDPRFGRWNRTLVKSEWTDRHGRRRSCWPEMWPLTNADRDADPALDGRMTLEEIRESVGPQVYSYEYLGEPGESDQKCFPPLVPELHGWWLSDHDGNEGWASTAKMNWRDQKGELKTQPLRELLQQSRVFITSDTSFSARPDSDWKVSTVMMLTSANELFVLDLWGGKTNQPRLVQETFRLADLWRVQAVYPEVVSASVDYYHELDSISKQRASEITGTQWIPAIIPLSIPKGQSKTNRIEALSTRFRHGLIKFPLHRRFDPHWSQLFDQIEAFNPEANHGGLEHDDHIDTVSMSLLVLKGKPARAYVGHEEEPDALDLLRRGQSRDRHGELLLPRLDFGTLTVDTVMGLIDTPTTGPSRDSAV